MKKDVNEKKQKRKTTLILVIILLISIAVLVGLIVYFVNSDECTHPLYLQKKYDPTCDEKGYTRYTCATCGYYFDADFVAPIGHTLTSTVVEPTCDREGYTAHSCSVCGIEDRDNFVRPRGHTYSKEVTAPTCEDQGYTIYTCDDCDFWMKRDYVAPLGHDVKDTVIESTCEEPGYTIHKCKNCDYQYINDYTPLKEHDYIKEYVRPNIGQTGYTVYTCKTCHDSHIDDYVFYSDIFSGAEGTGEGALAMGVDLSKWSKDVDFHALKAAGVDFVILRVGYDTDKDVRFEEYYAGAKAAGLDVGVYYFTLAENKADAIVDSERVALWLRGKQLEYPVFYDVEDYGNYKPSTFSEQQIMDIVHTFMTHMVEKGYYPGLYTNNNLLYNIYNDEKTLRLYDVWYARYTTVTDELILENSSLYSMWQYDGDVEGYLDGAVEGACDLNYCFKNYPEIIKKFGFNGYQ